jgi:hypothetical protein
MTLPGQALERLGVDSVRTDLERVAAAAGDEDAVAECLAKPRDVDLHRLRGGIRRGLAPQLVGDPRDRDHLAAVKQQDRQHRPRPRAAELSRLPIEDNLEPAQQAELDPRSRDHARNQA